MDVTAAADQEDAIGDGPTSAVALTAGPVTPYAASSSPPPSGPSLERNSGGGIVALNSGAGFVLLNSAP